MPEGVTSLLRPGAAPAPCVAIVTDEPGWHGRRLRAALAGRGYASRYVSATACDLDLSDGRAQVRLPGFEAAPPAGVFVRGIPGGTLEQVILRLDALHGLRLLDVVVYNDARTIERTVDKAQTTFLLRLAGLPTPDTWVCESVGHARAVAQAVAAEGGRLVCKPLFGSQGSGLRLVAGPADLEAGSAVGGVWYLQRFIDRPGGVWSDYRVFVVGGRACAAMRRTSRHWIVNRAQGGHCEAVPLEPALRALAEGAAAAVEADYAGVDLMHDAAGRLTVIEVNGVPAWLGLQGVSTVDIAGTLCDHFVARMEAGGTLRARR